MNKIIKIIISIIILLFILYWAKNLFRINFFSEFSLSEYFPFSLLQNDVEIIPKEVEGVLFYDDFESTFASKQQWKPIWSQENSLAELNYKQSGYEGSSCIEVRSYGLKSWVYETEVIIETSPVDSFTVSAMIAKSDSSSKCYLGFNTYDNRKEISKWNLIKIKSKNSNTWQPIKHTFSVPGEASYIKLRIVGKGRGFFRLDNILLARE